MGLSSIKSVYSHKAHLRVSNYKFQELPHADQVPLLDEVQQQDPGWIRCTG